MKDEFEIFVPSDRTFIVQRTNGGNVENWRELEEEAKAFVEPLLRARWAAYWDCLHTRSGTIDTEHATLREVMDTPSSPSMFYPCSSALAAKARVRTWI